MRWPTRARTSRRRSPSGRPDCEQVARVLQAFLDGELPADETDLVTRHLRECDRCGLEARVVRQVIEHIRRQRPDLASAPLSRLSGFAAELTVTEVSERVAEDPPEGRP